MILDTGPDGASALFSDTRSHRYRLERVVYPESGLRTLVVCGLNPSTADAFQLDPTCRREIAFARAWNCWAYIKVNAYAWRATQPAAMWAARKLGEDIVGPENDEQIRIALAHADIAVAAWGVHAEPERVAQLVDLAGWAGARWQCLGVNKAGSPKHPLYVRADTPLQLWSQGDSR